MENKNTYIAYGLVTGLVIVIINIALSITGMIYKPEYRFVSMISYIPFLIGIVMNAIAFSKSRDGFVTYGNVFGNCFKATLVITVVMVVWSAISLFVFPEMKDKITEMQREQMVQKNMTDEQIDMAIGMTKKYWNLFMFLGAILGTMILGAIFSLIGAAVAKKKGVTPFTATNF
jgi:hypothetical protein